ncbi:uncharacterized protein LOC109788202 isoform X2 [Cajanus cajan]|uniref:uncharacterized protein LOC109788202 isoform X2 n=1 Tax=Cajanus cajan TaxID=3821 RepID=UPI0010FB9283|nr:uncharacterized protein LOC109788202 isoform X2 [Cajanus cajan]
MGKSDLKKYLMDILLVLALTMSAEGKRDKLMTVSLDSSSSGSFGNWIFKNKEHGETSAAASLVCIFSLNEFTLSTGSSGAWSTLYIESKGRQSGDSVTETYVRGSELQIPDCTDYFMENLQRLSDTNYVPTKWITVVRKHAEVIVDDDVIFSVFKKYCKRRPPIDTRKGKLNLFHNFR